MKKNKVITSLIVSAVAVSAVFSTGCNISTNNLKDMEQVIATVNITKAADTAFSDTAIESGITEYKEVIEDASITKMELILYFFDTGYSYVQSSGYTYTETFNLLISGLAGNKVLTQYATMYLLNEKVKNDSTLTADSVKATYKAMGSNIEKLEYLLDEDEINAAKYSVYKSFNTAIDSNEKTNASSDDSTSSSSTDTRTTPDNVDTENDDYYPKDENGNLNYGIYTGFSGYLLSDSGTYQDDKIEGTTKSTRKRAYNAFISYLNDNGFVDVENEDLTDILNLNYFKQAYESQLQNSVLTKYYNLFEDSLSETVKGEGETLYSYLQSRYNELYKDQSLSNLSTSSFETSMSSLSDSSFIVYAPNTTNDTDADENGVYGTFGYVYNILLPFSDEQSVTLSALQEERDRVLNSSDNPTKAELQAAQNTYYYKRNQLMNKITTTDQRSAWFNGETEYAFEAKDKVTDWYKKGNSDGTGVYLFFENNLTNNEQYKTLEKYDGRYPYNGTAVKTKDDTYVLTPNKLSIDTMLSEFTSYVDYVLGNTTEGDYYTKAPSSDYYATTDFYQGDDIDYSNFVYASGNFGIADSFNPTDLLNKESKSYKVMSAVNELQYAYTTDTSVLSQFVGYNVSAYDTSYIKEFEYAAKQAVNSGVGSFIVCAGDYGWHLIYVTYTFDYNGGAVYGEPDWTKIDIEGTFENLFYESIKSSDISNAQSNRQSVLLQLFYNDDTVEKYQSRYQNLLDLDND